jgi:hypothetical protein
VVTTSSDADLPDAPPPVEVAAEVDAEVVTELTAPTTPTAPRSVVASYWMLLVSAALPVLIVILTLATWNSVVNQLVQQRPAGTTVAQASGAIHSYLIANITLDLIFAALYVGFAILMRRGRNWARLSITAIVAVFAVLGVLNNSGLVTLISILIELAAIGMLYTKPSKEYFAAMRQHRR